MSSSQPPSAFRKEPAPTFVEIKPQMHVPCSVSQHFTVLFWEWN